MDNQLIALYEIKRQTFLMGYIQNPEHFTSSLAFAYYHRMAPVLHENTARAIYGADPFDEIYAVKKDFISAVLSYVEDRALKGDFDSIAFYNLEKYFSGHRPNDVELIYTLYYARIDGRFDDGVWDAIEKNAPIEAKPIAKAFLPSEVNFY